MAVVVQEESLPVLKIDGLSKSFPGVRALEAVDLEVRPGEIHALVGQNGSGKSTLIKVLAGVHAPDDGAIGQVNGRPLNLGNGKAAHELGIRFVHQDLGLVDNLTAVDNLALGFGYATGTGGRIRWAAQRARAAEALSYVVDDFPLDRLAGNLTSFQRTALAIARALQDWRANGSLLILDEPTATMPRGQVEHLFSLLRRVRDRGTPVLLVTHHLEEVFAVSDRVTVLRDGRRVVTSDVAAVDTPGLVGLMTGGVGSAITPPSDDRFGDVVLSLSEIVGDTVHGVDLEVRRGEIVGVGGLGGSGRDELCSLIFGSMPRRGVVRVANKALRSTRPDDAVRARVGLVPANRHRQGLMMTQSVRWNMTLTSLREFVHLGRIHHRDERGTVSKAIKDFGVKTPSSETMVGALSGGNQQKVVLAKWLRMNPSVLLLDEPTQGVDVAAQVDLHQLIFNAAAAGTAVLVCSSDEHELSALCDRVLVMRDGRIDAELDRANASAEAIFEATLQPAQDPSRPTREMTE